ncbi:hypothetical protein B0T22DRAFT_520501 [Podospora appendiculata]|uniref:Ecp2 effector protein domain-containing protein n=1 Tax=Podospora appendiculata TaxID=314037 RepID=A0AAE1C9H0_9PEZI|nr:hypothetical protein B0T22DRAFT_520501 [Podospora appendiculata]
MKSPSLLALLLLSTQIQAVSIGGKLRASVHTQLLGESGELVMELLVENYTGPVSVAKADYTDHRINTVAYNSRTDIGVYEDRRRDACSYIRECAGYLRNQAAARAMKTWLASSNGCKVAANGVIDYFTRNNYEQGKAFLTGSVVSIAWAIPVASVTYYFNARLDNMNPKGNDGCNQGNNPETIATHAGSQMYEFCLDLQARAVSQVRTRYVIGDTREGKATGPNGETIVGKFFIDDKEFTTTDVCRDYGIIWRRDFLKAVRRGASRMAGHRE